jgi:predicted phage terminase large subunit-like protein
MTSSDELSAVGSPRSLPADSELGALLLKDRRRTIRQHLTAWTEYALAPFGQKPARHHGFLIGELERVERGELDRLMVFMPPGSAKSTYASLLFPAWWFCRHPRSAVIAASHTGELAAWFGRRVRNMVAEHAATIGYNLATGNAAAGRWDTDAGGEYYAAGIGGSITGRRADLAIIDDPVKSREAGQSEAHRKRVWDWFRADLLTRLKPRGRIILIMTRWHEDDLAGRLLLTEADRWKVLSLSAVAGEDDPMRRAPGEPLWPEWESAAELADKRRTLGERDWSALYQQDPRPAEGALFRVGRIQVLDAEPSGIRAVRSWDLAATAAVGTADPDWTVGLKLGRLADGRFVVLDVVRLRGGPDEVEEAIAGTAGADGREVLIELPQDPGQAGKGQVLYLARRLAGFRVGVSPETGSKVTRAAPVASQVNVGNVSLVRASWNRALLDELAAFPSGRHDDQVDALARAFGALIASPEPARQTTISIMGR